MTRLISGAMDRKTAKDYDVLVEYDKKAGNPEMYRLPDTEFQRWVDLTKPLREGLLAELEEKGFPARDFYEEAVRLVEKYSKEVY